jgi:hypothetical protein
MNTLGTVFVHDETASFLDCAISLALVPKRATSCWEGMEQPGVSAGCWLRLTDLSPGRLVVQIVPVASAPNLFLIDQMTTRRGRGRGRRHVAVGCRFARKQNAPCQHWIGVVKSSAEANQE